LTKNVLAFVNLILKLDDCINAASKFTDKFEADAAVAAVFLYSVILLII